MPARFFSGPGSVFSTAVPANAPISSSSAAYVADLADRLAASANGLGWWISRWDSSPHVYLVNNATPKVPVYLNEPEGTFYAPDLTGNAWNKLSYVWRQGCPVLNTFEAGHPADWIMLIHNTDSNELFEFYQMWKDTTPGAIVSTGGPNDPPPGTGGPYDVWTPRWGGYTRDATAHTGQYNDASGATYQQVSSWQWGVTATSLSAAGGLVLEEELIAGVIPHALQMQIANGDGYVWPAYRGDLSFGIIPEGTRFRLKPSFNVNSITHATVQGTRTAKMLATAAQTYGIIVNDRTAGVGMRFEWPQSDTVYYSIADQPGSLNEGAPGVLAAALPTSQLEVIDPSWRPPPDVPLPPPIPPTAGGSRGRRAGRLGLRRRL